MTGSTKTKKTITKPKVPQSVIDNWLKGHPDVNPSGFTFSMLKDLKLTGSTKTVKSSADTKTLVSNKMTKTYERLKNIKSGNTFSFSSITESLKSMSGQPKTGWGEPKSGTPRTLSAKTDIDYSKIPKKFRPIDKTLNFSTATKTFTPKIKLSGQTRQSLNFKTSLNQIDLTTIPITAGTIDYSFPNYVINDTSFDDAVYAIAVQTDGKILVGGNFGDYYYSGSPYYSPYLIRLNSDGTVDETFSTTDGEDDYGGSFNNSVYTIAVQPDGKILVGGEFTTYDRNCCTYENVGKIIRLNSDGSRDLSFNVGSSGFNDSVYIIVIQPNGKILVGGEFYQYNDNQYERSSGLTSWRIIRLNENGSQDTTFDTGNGFDWGDYGNVNTIKLQPDGKILVGGNFYDFNGYMANNIVRLNSNGSYDTSFLMGVGFDNYVNSIDLQSDGKIIVGGNFQDYGYYNGTYLGGSGIVRLTSNGTLDNTFGFGFGNEVYTVNVLSDDKIVVGGDFNDYYPIFEDGYTTDLPANKLVRFYPDCTIDWSFYREFRFDGTVTAVAITPENDILVGGSFGADGIDAPFEYFGKIHNPVSEYPYIYTVANNVCTSVGFCGSTFTYITVGSNEPLNVGIFVEADIYSFVKPSGLLGTEVGCAVPTGLYDFPYPSTQVDYVVDKNYGDFFTGGCETAFVDNYKIALVNPVFNDGFGTFPLLVDKNYKVGDFGFFNQYWDSFSFSLTPVYFHINFEIIDFITVNDLEGPLLPISALSYIPYSSAEELVSANGQYIDVGDCNAPCGTYPLSKQYDICFTGKTISLDLCTNCGYVYQTISIFSDEDIPYSYISGGTPTINSTKTWDSCTECATNNTPEGEINYDFFNVDPNSDIYTIVEQPDEKILIGGDFTTINNDGNVVNYLARLNSNGSPDTSFNAENNRLNLVNPNSPVSIWKQQGYIFTLDYDNNEINVFKVVGNKMTSVISNYGFSGELPWQIYGDGKYLYVLDVSDGSPGIYVYEFNTNTESLNYITTNSEYFSLQYSQMWGDDEFIYATTAENFETNQTLKAYKLSGGTLSVVGEYTGDTFNSYNSVFVQNGYIFVGTNTGLWVLTFNGTEFTYITDYSVTTDSVAVNGDGTHIYLADWGTGEDADSTLFAFSFDGESLTEITSAGVSGQLGNLNTIWCDSEGIIWMSSGWDQYSYFLLGYKLFGNSFGQVRDLYFNQYNEGTYPIGIINDNVNYYILTSKDIRFYNLSESQNNYFIERGFDGDVYSIALQPDGKILVGGDFTHYNGEYAGRIIRLNSDGSIDQGFTSGGDEFNNSVYAIAVQNDGKIVVGGDFGSYYYYSCNGYARLNSDGTFDTTFKHYPFEGTVYSILLENDNKTQYYTGVDNKTQNIIIGGDFGMSIPELELSLSCLSKFDPDGTFINTYENGFNSAYNGVFDMKKQSDGKLICVGGFDEYQGEYCPWNIIRINTDGSQDLSFVGKISDDGGGFNDGYVYSIQILPNGKIMIGSGSDYFYDRNDDYENLGFLVRLNSNGTLDTTFTYVLDDDYVEKVLLRKDKTLLVGGDFTSPYDYLLDMFIGEDFQLRAFTTCDGGTANIYLPSTFENTYVEGSLAPITSIDYSEITTGGLDLFVDGLYDDDYWTVGFPSGFSVNFLQTNYTSVNVSSNPYITFGDPEIGSDAGECCFDIPDGIPTSTEQPGVYLSFQCPDEFGNYDAELYELYSGLTDGGNTMVIKYVGSDHCDEIATLIYGFRFYKDEPNYFDLIIEENTNFFNDNPTGGVSNGVDPSWVSTFDSSSLKAYRISAGTIKPIKADINTSNVVCGQVGDVIYTPQTGTTGQPEYFISTDTDTTYDSCSGCTETNLYKTKLFVRDGGVTPNYVKNVLMTYSDIQNVLTNGPIFTIVRPECYEILTYNL